MTIEYCDICEHPIGSSLSNAFPKIYRVNAIHKTETELMLCNKCHNRLFRVILMESRKEWKKELKGMRK